jgi:hypothetical protein
MAKNTDYISLIKNNQIPQVSISFGNNTEELLEELKSNTSVKTLSFRPCKNIEKYCKLL